MQVIKKPEDGKKFVEYEVSGSVISFRDDELTANLKKKERDDEVVVYVYEDYMGGLIMSATPAKVQLAEVHIPARQYVDTETENPDFDPKAEEGPENPRYINTHEPVPFSMDNVTLILFEEE